MKKVLLIGADGMLGGELKQRLEKIYDVEGTTIETLDICNKEAVLEKAKQVKPYFIINCAAYTAVDKAETDIELATKINVDGPRNLAKSGAKVIHISTDYVFDGTGYKPYNPDEKTNPVSVYGKTKRAGELAVIENADVAVVIRTAWLYSPYGNNFVKTMRRLGVEKDSLNVVADQIGTPTYAADLADAIVKIIPQITSENSGVYHFTNEGVCSWYDFDNRIC